MVRLFHKIGKYVAAVPGTLDFVGDRKVDKVRINLIDYDAEKLEERELSDISECLPFRDTDTTLWINVCGLHDVDILKSVGDQFGLHPLVQEDILNTYERPKLDDFKDYIFIAVRMVRYDTEAKRINSEQVSLVIGRGVMLSFQERSSSVFESVRERLLSGQGRIRGMGADYLGYALVDTIVDHYFVVLEAAGDAIEELEARLLDAPDKEILENIHELKCEMLLLRRSVWPLRDVVAGLLRIESPLMSESVQPFLRDVHDHVVQVVDAVDIFRDMLSGLQDLYLSSVSNRMNNVMKMLTIFASIFVPLTFVTGIYGMNFTNMPELAWKWSYPIFWAVTLVGVGSMIMYFRRKGWF